MSDDLHHAHSSMSDDLQELLQIPPVRFLKMLKTMSLDLDSLHCRIFPVLRRRIDDHTEGECDEIRIFLEDTDLQLKMLSLLRSASTLMVPMFSATEIEEMDNWLDMITQFEEELNKAVEWLHGVLDKCSDRE